MKKTILFLFAVSMLASCSQDDGATGGGDTPKAKISFEVTSPTFDVDIDPLETKSESDSPKIDYSARSFLQYIFYKESGEVVLNKIIEGTDLEAAIKSGSVAITEELPIGKYYIAVGCGGQNPQHPYYYHMTPENYHTDYFYPNASPSSAIYDNSGYYYQTLEYALEPVGGSLQIELEPVYTKVTLKIENPKTFKIPVGTEMVYVYMDPAFRGFSIKDKKAKNENLPAGVRDVKIYQLSDIRSMETFATGFTSVASDSETTIIFEYRKYAGGIFETEVIDTQEVKTFSMPENGMSYDIHGSLEVGNSASNRLGLSIKEFSKETVDIPFGN